MAPVAKILLYLPPYGPPATAFPPEWGRVGREGVVVEFSIGANVWVGNFRPGVGDLQFAGSHPNGQDIVIIANGDLWIVNPIERRGERVLPALDAIWALENQGGWLMSRQGLALARLGQNGLVWHTRRLSWDGFDQITVVHNEVRGLGWSAIDETWQSFVVELDTGKSTGGAYNWVDTTDWERLKEEESFRDQRAPTSS
jgi:hypothetical protein